MTENKMLPKINEIKEYFVMERKNKIETFFMINFLLVIKFVVKNFFKLRKKSSRRGMIIISDQEYVRMGINPHVKVNIQNVFHSLKYFFEKNKEKNIHIIFRILDDMK